MSDTPILNRTDEHHPYPRSNSAASVPAPHNGHQKTLWECFREADEQHLVCYSAGTAAPQRRQRLPKQLEQIILKYSKYFTNVNKVTLFP